MATKYHINDRGEPGICNAVHRCRFGRDEDQHFDSVDEARTAYEQEKVNELFPQGIDKDNLGRRDLNKLAKYTDDQDVLRQGIETGSPRIRASILKNRNAEEDVLRALYTTVEDGPGSELEKNEIISHPNYPAIYMSDEDLAIALKARGRLGKEFRDQLLRDNEIGDRHIGTLQKLDSYSVIEIAGNNNNQLKRRTRYDLLTQDSPTTVSAIRKGLIPAYEIKGLDSQYFTNLSWESKNITDPEQLDQITSVALTRRHGDDISDRTLDHLVYNKNLSRRAIEAIATSSAGNKNSDQYKEERDVALYKLPNTDSKTRKLLVDRSTAVADEHRVDQIAEKAGGRDELKKRIIKERDSFSAGRSYNKTRVTFDKDELNKLGMGEDEVLTLMGRGAWNADFKYNEETGEFIGGIDSSD